MESSLHLSDLAHGILRQRWCLQANKQHVCCTVILYAAIPVIRCCNILLHTIIHDEEKEIYNPAYTDVHVLLQPRPTLQDPRALHPCCMRFNIRNSCARTQGKLRRTTSEWARPLHSSSLYPCVHRNVSSDVLHALPTCYIMSNAFGIACMLRFVLKQAPSFWGNIACQWSVPTSVCHPS